jgi:hypothetical protein
MEKSLFPQWVDKLFKTIALKVVEKLNGTKNPLVYFHRTMLRKEFSPTLKWGSLSVNNNVVAADVVAMDSSLPLKKRDSLRKADGDIPKIGMKLSLNETTMNELNILLSMGGQDSEVIKKLFGDTDKAIGGIWERLEYMFHEALSTGYALVPDEDNPGLGIRVDFGHPDSNKYGVAVVWTDTTNATPITDITHVMNKARMNGDSLRYMLMDVNAWNQFKANAQVRQEFAFNMGFVGTNVPNVPSVEKANEFLGASYGLQIIVIDRHVMVEKNGTRKSIKPWADNAVVFLTDLMVGTLTYGRLAEETFQDKSVDYAKVDDFILVSKYHKNDPIKEFTSAQALVLPVINNVDSIYIMDVSDAEATSGQTEGDATITIFGDTGVLKTNLVNALVAVGKPATIDMTDVQLIQLVNKLSKAKELQLRAIIDAPEVNAGADAAADSATEPLLGTATAAEGKSIASVQWSQVSGPNTAGFSAPTALSTNATGLITGVYVFRLTATDSAGTTASDTVTITATVA